MNKPTIQWPKDHDFFEAIKYSEIYNRRICKYIIRQYENEINVETPKDDFWIEHILPFNQSEKWLDFFTKEEWELYRNTLANLIPLTSEMNGSEGQNLFEQKRKSYENSIFSTARHISKIYTAWTPNSVEDRATHLGEWALGRWKF